MTPYQYVHNNPIMFTDPTGMIANAIDGPGDEFKTLEAAAKDFGMEYNGFSIAYDIEVSTLFYSYQNANNETAYSYITPHVGMNVGMASQLGPSDLKSFADKMAHKGVRAEADGHTHGSAALNEPIRELRMDTERMNEFSLGDIQAYINHPDNGNRFNRRINGVMIAPTGEGFIFYEKNYPELNAESFGILYKDKIKNVSQQSCAFGGVPSDKKLMYSRAGNNSNYSEPKVAPINNNGVQLKRRKGY